MSAKLMLDASRENDCPDGFLAVESEIEFLRLEGGEHSLFVRGELLCSWARELYQARGLKEGLAFVELQSPRNRLRLLIGDWANNVQADFLARVVDLLKQHPNLTRGELLARLTGADFWSEKPSREHAARWLLAEFGAELTPLVEAVRELWVRNCANEALRLLYQLALNERQAALKEWLSADDESVGLGIFPLAVEGMAAKMLKDLWGQKLRQTNGQAMATLATKEPNGVLIAREAHEYFRHRPEHLNQAVLARIGSWLTPQQQAHLECLIPRPKPILLAPTASEQEAIAWAVKQYLPYRQWQVKTALAEDSAAAEELGGSFGDWLLENYPRLTTIAYEKSPLNVRAKYLIAELVKTHRVLWVVVDGLNYINHLWLLKLLARTEAALAVGQDETLLAVLPTITEKAKYALTSGLLPGQNLKGRWKIQTVLADSFPQAKYAGKTQVHKIKAWLADESVSLSYWNMTAIDECYHEQTDPGAIANNVEAQLSALAGEISRLVTEAANPDRIAVVISTDHGQMLGPCSKYAMQSKDADTHGRTAKGDPFGLGGDNAQAYLKAADNSAVLLDPMMFCLSEPTTLALGAYHFGERSKDSQGQVWGVHGGLFPEEVVVGFAVLFSQPQRQPLMARLTGDGEAGKPGRLRLQVDNPNPATVRLLTLTLNEVDDFRHPQPVLQDAEKHTLSSIELELSKFPNPVDGEALSVTGTVTYEFADGVRHECAVIGVLNCKQMYSGQRPSLRDRFKK